MKFPSSYACKVWNFFGKSFPVAASKKAGIQRVEKDQLFVCLACATS